MTDATPFDADRARYSREALARLVLCDQAAELAEFAAGLLCTAHDTDTGAGGRASQAAQILELAQELLRTSVVYERERGSSWIEIGHYLATPPEHAETEYRPAVDGWHAAFETPYRDDVSGLKRVPNLPPAAYDPERRREALDFWATRHLPLLNDPTPVTSGLRLAPRPADAG